MKFYALLIAVIAVPIIVAVIGQRMNADDAKLKIMKESGLKAYDKLMATTNPSDCIKAIREDNDLLAARFHQVDAK